jgi:hypothetical protein
MQIFLRNFLKKISELRAESGEPFGNGGKGEAGAGFFQGRMHGFHPERIVCEQALGGLEKFRVGARAAKAGECE